MKKFSELTKDEEQRALDIYRKAIVIDPVLIPMGILRGEYLERIQKAGVTAAVASMNYAPMGPNIPSHGYPSFDYREAIKVIYYHLKWIEGSPDKAFLIDTADDINRAKREGKVAFTLGTHDARPLEAYTNFYDTPSVMMVTIFKKLGVKVIGLTHQDRNLLANGCAERVDGGLSNFGVRAVEEMNRLGMVIDIAHVGKKSIDDVLEISKDPVIDSHSDAFSITPNPRNKTDEQIKALAEKGGVFCVTGLSICCWTKKGIRPSVEDVLTHIDYVVDLVGVDHVGIGSDLMEGRGTEPYKTRWPVLDVPWTRTFHISGVTYAEGIDMVEGWPNYARGLVARGYSDQEIQKILGGNLLKLFGRVWKK